MTEIEALDLINFSCSQSLNDISGLAMTYCYEKDLGFADDNVYTISNLHFSREITNMSILVTIIFI
jgi:hypothetical protein